MCGSTKTATRNEEMTGRFTELAGEGHSFTAYNLDPPLELSEEAAEALRADVVVVSELNDSPIVPGENELVSFLITKDDRIYVDYPLAMSRGLNHHDVLWQVGRYHL